jgi:hypothetical protein
MNDSLEVKLSKTNKKQFKDICAYVGDENFFILIITVSSCTLPYCFQGQLQK